MKVYIACDHAAFEQKELLKSFIDSTIENASVTDLGTSSDERVDYPDFAKLLSEAVVKEEGSYGVLLCGSGIGMSMAANRYSGIRAALCRTQDEARLSKEHNNANVLCLGARTTPTDELKVIIQTWFDSQYEGGRHQKRVELFNNLGEKL